MRWMVNVFTLDMMPEEQAYVIKMDLTKFHCTSTVGSFNIMPARLLGLDYADYLRLCRDEFGATLYGRGSLYPFPVFSYTEQSKGLVMLLNKLANQVLFFRANPEYNEHKAAVDQWYKEHYVGYNDLMSWREAHAKLGND